VTDEYRRFDRHKACKTHLHQVDKTRQQHRFVRSNRKLDASLLQRQLRENAQQAVRRDGPCISATQQALRAGTTNALVSFATTQNAQTMMLVRPSCCANACNPSPLSSPTSLMVSGSPATSCTHKNVGFQTQKAANLPCEPLEPLCSHRLAATVQLCCLLLQAAPFFPATRTKTKDEDIDHEQISFAQAWQRTHWSWLSPHRTTAVPGSTKRQVRQTTSRRQRARRPRSSKRGNVRTPRAKIAAI
jgi:hypothetical protein